MTKSNDNSQVVSILSYFLIGIIWYFIDENVKKSKAAKFHVKQALNLIIVNFIIHVAVIFLTMITLGAFAFIAWIIYIVILILWVIGLINAINQKQVEIPVIGQFANKYLTF